jgi:hypothetical protein
MVVSHQHRFIFLKTRKTAGTSVEVFLSGIAGEDAIVTPVEPAEPGHRPRNFRGSWSTDFLPAMRADPGAPGALLRNPRGRIGLYRHHWNHAPAWLLRARLGEEVWNGYFKFCFERNPWDKFVSLYWWALRDRSDRPSLEEFIDSPRGAGSSDWPLYTLDGEIAVDAVGRYESLEQDLRTFMRRAGVAAEVELPRAKSSQRRRDEQLLSERSAGRIGALFRREVEAFGYECPPELLAA